ncbi:PrgI family protein [Ohessyouella blattaphilus]
MIIKMNKDFEREYQDIGFKGLTVKQSLTLIVGTVLYGGSALLLWYLTDLSPSVCVYIVLPIGAIVVAFGCYTYQGHNLWRLIRHYRYMRKTNILTTDLGEMNNRYYRTYELKYPRIKDRKRKKRRIR